jgi:hypothetical protein
MTVLDSPRKHFESALELLGESWLKNQVQLNDDSGEEKAEYSVPIPHDEPPPVAKAYRMAREDIQDIQTNIIELPEWRNETLEFLRLGKIYDILKGIPIIDPDGNQLENTTIIDLYRDKLRSTDKFESSRYELEVAAVYNEIGHTPALIEETESENKTPDIELIDLTPSVQVECKHCRKQSDEEAKQANRANTLFENIRSQLPQESHAVLIELDRTPVKNEVENIKEYLPQSETINSSRKSHFSLPFGEITIVSLPSEEPILYPKYDTEAFDIMNNIYNDIIRPAVSNYMNIDKDFTEFGNVVLLFESQERKATLLIRRLNFIGINESTWGTNVYNRLRNQFTDVSKKFDNKPSVLHIDFPNMNEGDSLQSLELRKHAGGALKLRPDISGVIISGLIHQPTFSKEAITRRRISIPHYQPNQELPEDYEPIDPEAAQSVDEMMKNTVMKELLDDPQGDKKAVAQDEGSLSFRFKPNESRPEENNKFIFDIISEDEKSIMKLSITPDKEIKLEYIDIQTGYWVCKTDVSDIPDLDPIAVYITWSPEEVDLYIGHESDDDLRKQSCENPIDDVEMQEGSPKPVNMDLDMRK